MNSTQTQRDSYHGLACKDLSNGQKAVMQAFKDTSTCYSRNQLEKVTGKRINVICPRVNELIAAGRLVVRSECLDEFTKKTVQVLGLPVPVQLELI